jgi:hypothetical protein
MSEHKTVELPISDCGYFVAGELPDVAAHGLFDTAPPKYGVIIWYEDKETAKAACIAASKAHWA